LKLKYEIGKAIDDNIIKKWKPAIHVSYFWHSDIGTDFKLERVMLGTKELPDGKTFDFIAGAYTGDIYTPLDDDGKNWKPIMPYIPIRDNDNIIPYTFENWKALLQLKQNLIMFQSNLKVVMMSKNLPNLIERLSNPNFLMLPKGDKD